MDEEDVAPCWELTAVVRGVDGNNAVVPGAHPNGVPVGGLAVRAVQPPHVLVVEGGIEVGEPLRLKGRPVGADELQLRGRVRGYGWDRRVLGSLGLGAGQGDEDGDEKNGDDEERLRAHGPASFQKKGLTALVVRATKSSYSCISYMPFSVKFCWVPYVIIQMPISRLNKPSHPESP